MKFIHQWQEKALPLYFVCLLCFLNRPLEGAIIWLLEQVEVWHSDLKREAGVKKIGSNNVSETYDLDDLSIILHYNNKTWSGFKALYSWFWILWNYILSQ